jgi:hypothetical protein
MAVTHRGHATARAPFLPPFPNLGLTRLSRPVLRRCRRPFRPCGETGSYRLPRPIHDLLTAALAPFRNAEAAYALAVFLGRYWSSEARLDGPFPIDRRALSDHKDLELTEAQVRGAIQTLERIGFLERPITGKGSSYRATEDGLRRKAILFVFGEGYQSGFRTANQRSNCKRLTPTAVSTRPVPTFTLALQSSTGAVSCGPEPMAMARHFHRPTTPDTNSPKNRISFEESVLMGEVVVVPSKVASPLEEAIARLQRAGGFDRVRHSGE